MIEILRFATVVIASIGTAFALLGLIIASADRHNEKVAIILISHRILGDQDSCTITEGDTQVTLKRIHRGVEIYSSSLKEKDNEN